MYNYDLALMAGTDIPIPELRTVLHQPTIKEIAFLGEQTFFIGINLLNINKNSYKLPEAAENINNFNLLMTFLQEPQMADKKEAVQQTLEILFPNYKIIFSPRSIILNSREENFIIDESNFEFLQSILRNCFHFNNNSEEIDYNPKDEKAEAIAEKLMQSRKRVAELKQKEENGDGSMFAHYISILTVGLNSMSLKDCLDLTVYQIQNLVERMHMYISWDLDIRGRLMGSSGDKPLKNWMDKIK